MSAEDVLVSQSKLVMVDDAATAWRAAGPEHTLSPTIPEGPGTKRDQAVRTLLDAGVSPDETADALGINPDNITKVAAA